MMLNANCVRRLRAGLNFGRLRATPCLRSVLTAATVLIAAPLCLAASHLPDATQKIGRIRINQDVQFTTNSIVALSMAGKDTGSGLSAMQFSNDGRIWSAAESYKTTRQWQLADGDYPPGMNTVLKTVYVRFRYGNGKWSRAVTDSILLARSAADVPAIREVWITQQRPADYSGSQPLGSRRNPHIVPITNNEASFDSLMYSLMTNYGTYYPAASGTNRPGPATNSTALTVHLGPGVYETHGDSTANGKTLAWSPRNGWRIIGAGKHATTLKCVHWLPEFRNVIGHYSTGEKGIGHYHNFEISDLTIDANVHEGGSYQYRAGVCINFAGNNAQVRRVRTKNAATTIQGFEIMHIEMHNFGSQEHGTHNVIIEDCDAVQSQVGNAYPCGLVGICGQYGPSGKMHYYHNVTVRNCYINGAAHEGDIPVNRSQYSVWDRGRFGIGIGGGRNVFVEDNHIEDVVMGYYIDSVRNHDIALTGNHFRNVCFGFSMDLINSGTRTNILEDTCRFESNLVELDPRFFPVRDTWQSIGRRYGFRTLASDKGPENFTFNKLIIENNVFQFTDLAAPEQFVEGFSAALQGVRTAQIRSNFFRGSFASLIWDNNNAYLERQADILDSANPIPLDYSANTTANGSVLEEYPFVLDKTLGSQVVLAGDDIAFPAPMVNGTAARMAQGAPSGGEIDGSGVFRWRTTPGDVGQYVVSFYSNTNRTAQPRRMLVKVLPAYPIEDDRWFAAGMAGYWRFDETEGSLLHDSSGNGLDVNIASALSKGRVALGWDGIAPGGAALGSVSTTNPGVAFVINNTEPYPLPPMPSVYHPLVSSNTSPLHPFTISLWFKADSATTQNSVLVTCTKVFYIESRPHATTPGLLGLKFANWLNDVAVETPTNITAGVWHHMSAVYSGSSARLYVDGMLAAEDINGQMPGWTQPQWLYIGGGGSSWIGFNGGLDELVVWSRSLAPDEVAWLYEAQKAGVDLPVKLIAPTAMTANSTSANRITLTWADNASNESGYRVERSVDGVNFTFLASLGRSATSFVDTPPESGIYTYRIAATNSLSGSALMVSAPVQYDEAISKLTVVTNGTGTVKCLNFSSNLLENGKSYSMTALPGTGSLFLNWTDGTGAVLTNQPTLVFAMRPKLTLAANFVPNPFLQAKGSYRGLFSPVERAHAQSGSCAVSILQSGAFTASFRLGAALHSVSGRFDAGGRAAKSIPRAGKNPLLVAMRLNSGQVERGLVGTVGDGVWVAELLAHRLEFHSVTNPAATFAGRYTVIVPGSPVPGLPRGNGSGAATVTQGGKISFRGWLADNMPLSQSSYLSTTGKWPLYTVLYGGHGSVWGWMELDGSQYPDDVRGALSWIRPSLTTARSYASGFTNLVVAEGARYTPPPSTTTRVLNLTNAAIIIEGGNVASPFTNLLTLSMPGNRLVSTNRKLSLSLTLGNGTFSGRIVPPGSTRTNRIRGALFQSLNCAYGYAFDTNQSAEVFIERR